MTELQSKLLQCINNLRDHEHHLRDARACLMRLHAEIASLENEVRSMEQDKASGQTIWNYFASFLPGGEARLKQQRQERDCLYRGKLATRRIKETEKTRRLAKIQAYETLVESYRRQAFSIESEIREKREKDLKDYQEFAKKMADQMKSEHRAQYSPRTTTCKHKAWWNRVKGHFRCSRCMKETRRFAFECPGCEKIACAPCRDVLRRKVR